MGCCCSDEEPWGAARYLHVDCIITNGTGGVGADPNVNNLCWRFERITLRKGKRDDEGTLEYELYFHEDASGDKRDTHSIIRGLRYRCIEGLQTEEQLKRSSTTMTTIRSISNSDDTNRRKRGSIAHRDVGMMISHEEDEDDDADEVAVDAALHRSALEWAMSSPSPRRSDLSEMDESASTIATVPHRDIEPGTTNALSLSPGTVQYEDLETAVGQFMDMYELQILNWEEALVESVHYVREMGFTNTTKWKRKNSEDGDDESPVPLHISECPRFVLLRQRKESASDHRVPETVSTDGNVLAILRQRLHHGSGITSSYTRGDPYFRSNRMMREQDIPPGFLPSFAGGNNFDSFREAVSDPPDTTHHPDLLRHPIPTVSNAHRLVVQHPTQPSFAVVASHGPLNAAMGSQVAFVDLGDGAEDPPITSNHILTPTPFDETHPSSILHQHDERKRNVKNTISSNVKTIKVCFSASGSLVAAQGADGILRLWNLALLPHGSTSSSTLAAAASASSSKTKCVILHHTFAQSYYIGYTLHTFHPKKEEQFFLYIQNGVALAELDQSVFSLDNSLSTQHTTATTTATGLLRDNFKILRVFRCFGEQCTAAVSRGAKGNLLAVAGSTVRVYRTNRPEKPIQHFSKLSALPSASSSIEDEAGDRSHRFSRVEFSPCGRFLIASQGLGSSSSSPALSSSWARRSTNNNDNTNSSSTSKRTDVWRLDVDSSRESSVAVTIPTEYLLSTQTCFGSVEPALYFCVERGESSTWGCHLSRGAVETISLAATSGPGGLTPGLRSIDGNSVVDPSGHFLLLNTDGTIRFCSLAFNRLQYLPRMSKALRDSTAATAISGDGTLIARGAVDGGIQLFQGWDSLIRNSHNTTHPPIADFLNDLPMNAIINGIAFNRQGTRLAISVDLRQVSDEYDTEPSASAYGQTFVYRIDTANNLLRKRRETTPQQGATRNAKHQVLLTNEASSEANSPSSAKTLMLTLSHSGLVNLQFCACGLHLAGIAGNTWHDSHQVWCVPFAELGEEFEELAKQESKARLKLNENLEAGEESELADPNEPTPGYKATIVVFDVRTGEVVVERETCTHSLTRVSHDSKQSRLWGQIVSNVCPFSKQ